MVSTTHKSDRSSALLECAQEDREALKVYCENFATASRILSGTHYSADGAKNKVPYNTYAMAQNVLTPLLAGRRPAASIETKVQKYQTSRLRFELALAKRLEQLHYAEVARQALVTSLYASMAIVKVGRERKGVVTSFAGEDVDVSLPYFGNVLLEDFAFDTQARDWRSIQYAANRVWVDYERYMDEADLESGAKDHLKATMFGEDPNERSTTERVSEISRGNRNRRSQYRKSLALWEFWLPDTQTVRVYSSLYDPHCIEEYEYKGPDYGPYHRLSYMLVPGQIMPLAVESLWRDLTEVMNSLINKVIRQADRQKTLTAYNDEEVLARIQDTPDGGSYYNANPSSWAETKHGGAEQVTIGVIGLAKNLFEEISGNLPLLGGTAAASGTATQDQMLSGAATQRIADMAHLSHEFHREVCTSIAADLWDDQLFTENLYYSPPGFRGEPIKMNFDPETRFGTFPEYDLKIEPFSMSVVSPQTQMAQIDQFVERRIIPAAQAMAAQGIQFDWKEYIKEWARANNVSERMARMVLLSGPNRQSDQEGSGKPASTQRNYVRENRSTSSNHGMFGEMTKMLMGGGGQNGSGNPMGGESY